MLVPPAPIRMSEHSREQNPSAVETTLPSSKTSSTDTISDGLAREIVDLVSKLTGFKNIICNQEGVIIAATQVERIGTVHAGARRILAGEADYYAVTVEEAAANPNIKEGYSLLISLNGKKLGTFGVTGKIEVVQPLAAIGSAVVSFRVKQGAQKNFVGQIIGDISEQIRTAMAAIQQLSVASEELASITSNVVRLTENAGHKVNNSNQILDINKKIAGQVNLLGLNASIESARAGEHGRGFAVVAKEMQALATSSSATSKNIGTILKEIQNNIKEVTEATQHTAAISYEQATAMREIVRVVDSIQKLTMKLETSF